MISRQRGSATIVALIIIVIMALGLAFWWVWRQNHSDQNNGGDAAHNGLELAQNYQVVEAGGSSGRLEALPLNNEFTG